MDQAARRPNLIMIMSDDHAAHAIGSYGSRINRTPHLDRIAAAGMRFDNCFCTNAICTPSRAAILTGEYNHVNEVRTLFDTLDNTRPQLQKDLRQAGYQTALVGKWHLGHGPENDPAGFDYWRVLPGQGDYHDPELIGPDGPQRHPGYVTDIITDLSLGWLDRRDPTKPFLMMINHKAPHRPWDPDAKHATLYDDVDIPEPPTFDDDHVGRSAALDGLRMSMADLNERDLKQPVPFGLSAEEERSWRYQRYIKDYLRCIASIDDNVGRVLDWVDEQGLTDDTVIIYTSDQGFFLGDHGWYDKRLMYEESLRMPLLVSYPPLITPGSVCTDLVTNVDFAPTLLELAGVPLPERLQGYSLTESLAGRPPAEPQTCVYYRYWEHLSEPHAVPAHLGVRTERYKLICYLEPAPGGTGYRATEFELYDLELDAAELVNLYDAPEYAAVAKDLVGQLRQRQLEVDDRDLVAGLP